MRWLLVGLALLALPAVAWGQSDERKVAIFVQQAATDGPHGLTAERSDPAVFAARCKIIVEEALQKMGVPYHVFVLADSAEWGSPGVDDSTWFREQGYMFQVLFVGRMHTSDNQSQANYFGDGTIGASPLGGLWSTPTLVYTSFATRGSDWEHGWWNQADKAGNAQYMTGAANGDTLEFEATRVGALYAASPTVMANTEVLFWSDTLATQSNWEDGVTGTYSVANKYKNCYNFVIGQEDVRSKMTPIFLGLSYMFDDAAYVPRRKMALFLTIDHPFPDTGAYPISVSNARTASYDSLMAHAREKGWVINVQTQAWSGDSEASLTGGYATTIGQNVQGKDRALFVHNFHDHNVGMIFRGDFVDVAGADTTNRRQKWNFLTARLADTLQVNLSSGYAKLWGSPSGALEKRYIRIVAEAGFYGFRSSGLSPDSVAHHAKRGWPTPGDWSRKWPPVHTLWIDPVTPSNNPRWMWMHDISDYPPTDTSWAAVPNLPATNFGWGVSLCKSALYSGTTMWHLQQNMLGPDPIFVQRFRRLRYLAERCASILDVAPYIQPMTPRRHNVARP